MDYGRLLLFGMCYVAALYAGQSFIAMDFNPLQWKVEARALMVFLFFGGFFGYWLFG